MSHRNNVGEIQKNSVLALMMTVMTFFVVPWGCTGHVNPFDPKSETKGDPFDLKAETGYGQIHLDWQWPTYPAVNGNLVKIDSFIVYRTDETGRPDTFNLGLQNGFTDTSILGDQMYDYEVAAYRGEQESGHSRPKSSLAFPMPLNCRQLSENSFLQPPSITFFNGLKFIPSGNKLLVFDANDIQLTSAGIYSNTVDLVLASDTSSDSAYIYLCSTLNDRVFAFLWNNDELKFICETIFESAHVLAVDLAHELVYAVSAETREVLELPIGTCQATITNMKTGRDPASLITVPEHRLLVSANKGDNTVSVFDLNTKSLLHEIPVPAQPNDLWIGPDSKLYVACQGDNVVQIIDLEKPGTAAVLQIPNPADDRTGLSPISVTGFSDPQLRHAGVLAVTACAGEFCEKPNYILYYALEDLKLRRFVDLQDVDSPDQATWLTRYNPFEQRLYMMLTNTIMSCELK